MLMQTRSILKVPARPASVAGCWVRWVRSGQHEQYLCAAMLRPGNAPATKGAIGLLARLLPLLRRPQSSVRVFAVVGRSTVGKERR